METKILLCSTSPIKIDALSCFFKEASITTFNCDSLGLPPQPINSALQCAKARLDYAKSKCEKDYDMYISIENGLKIIDDRGGWPFFADHCYVLIDNKSILSEGFSSVEISYKYMEILRNMKKNLDHELGNNITFGEILHEKNPDIDPKNWMKTICNLDRKDMIKDALEKAFTNYKNQEIEINKVIQAYKEYPDFPKPGVLFQDIFAVLADKDALCRLCQIMKNRYHLDKVDYIVGLESRGFFGVLMAKELNIGFVPIRKAGKLPGPVDQISYGTEYSKDTCEISKDIPEGSRVIIFDDLIATGGSLAAATTLLEENRKCIVVDCCVLREVVALRDKAINTLGRRYTVLLQTS